MALDSSIIAKSVIFNCERNYCLSLLKFSAAPFKSVSGTIRGTQGYDAGRADKGALSRLIYILRLTTAPSYEEREKSRETRQINSPGGRAFALARAGKIYQNSRQQ